MQTVSEALRSIAENIATYGHYQGSREQKLMDGNGDGECCLIVNPTMRALRHRPTNDLYWATKDAMIAHFAGHQTSIAHFSDVTDTAELLFRLRDLADQLEAS